MQRGFAPLALAGALVIVFAAGCAQPGTADTATQVSPESPRPAPSRFVAACADRAASPGPTSGAPATARPPTGGTAGTPDPSAPPNPADAEEQFRLNNEANKAFRNRAVLPPQTMAALQPCVEQVRAGLDRLRKEGRFDGPSIGRVLTDAGLAEVESRPPGRLDANAGGVLLFCGTAGIGYVFGEHGQPRTTVEAGGGIADGGCLPAPD